MWHGIYSFILFVLGAAIILVALKIYPHQNNIGREKVKKAEAAFENNEPWTRYDGCLSITSHEYDFAVMTGRVLPKAACAALVLWGVSLLNLTWLQIWIAPRVFLVEYAANLIK